MAKPLLEGLVGLGGSQRGDSAFLLIERNMMTGNVLTFAGLGDVLHETAFSTGMSACRIAKIQAGQRVLERRRCFMRRTNRTAVSAVRDEGQFEFQFLQKSRFSSDIG